MTQKQYILLGTSKGLVIFRRKAGGWEIDSTHFFGLPASVVFADERNGRWWVGLAHRHWGQKLHYSDDQGATWTQVPTPEYPKTAELKPGQPARLKKIWYMTAAGADQPEELYLGTEPGGLFHSNDGGQSFQLVESLWQHPSRQNPMQWFGAGRNQPFLHSIVVDPRDAAHLYVGVSCAGVFESTDAGKSWEPRNEGLIAAYLPNPEAEIGHDPHRILACESNPDVLWQQNHCGIFRSTDGGKIWENVTDKNGLADYGFALAIDHENPERAWVIPATSDDVRIAPDLALCVCRTDDGGETWTPLRDGLPQEKCFDIVFRHSLAIDKNTLVFGTTTGNVYLSENYGNSWHCLSNNLARVECIVFA